MQPRISMITLGVADLERATAFYRDGLGLPLMDHDPGISFFPLNGSWLALYERGALADDAAVAAEGSGFPGFTLSHVVGSEAEVDELLERAVAAGAELTKPGQRVFWGGYSGYFRDPDGFLWEVAHNPFFWIGPADTAGNQE